MYKVFCDGASRSNPGEAAIGVSIQENDDEIHTISEAIGIASNKPVSINIINSLKN